MLIPFTFFSQATTKGAKVEPNTYRILVGLGMDDED